MGSITFIWNRIAFCIKIFVFFLKNFSYMFAQKQTLAHSIVLVKVKPHDLTPSLVSLLETYQYSLGCQSWNVFPANAVRFNQDSGKFVSLLLRLAIKRTTA